MFARELLKPPHRRIEGSAYTVGPGALNSKLLHETHIAAGLSETLTKRNPQREPLNNTSNSRHWLKRKLLELGE